jgi:hypothetical protein
MVGSSLRVVVLGFLFAFPCVACSDDDDGDDGEEVAIETGTCNGVVAGGSTCTEFKAEDWVIADEQMFCTDVGDVWTNEPCPVTVDLLGCCRYTFIEGEAYLECYYTGHFQTAAELAEECVDFLEGTWTAGGRG